ncbi:MAG: YciI family protein [Humibacter sp.]
MRYLLLIHPDLEASPSMEPDEALMEGMGRLIEEMTKAGVLLDTAGLRPLEEATRIRLSNGVTSVVDGPFTESKEFVGGYCLLQTHSKDEAVEWGIRFLRVHGSEWTMEVEVRQVEQS